MAKVARILVLDNVPTQGNISIQDLSDKVHECSQRIRETVPSFEFSYWARGTIFEVLDYCEVSGILDVTFGSMKRYGTNSGHDSTVRRLDLTVQRRESIAQSVKDILENIGYTV